MKKLHIRLRLLAIVALTAITGNALATSTKSAHYSGSSCHPTLGHSVFGADVNVISYPTGIYNLGDSYVSVICPIVKHVTKSQKGIEEIKVMWNGIGRMYCFLNSVDHNGYIRQSTFGQSNHPFYVNGGGFTMPAITNEPDHGSYSLQCLIPPKAKLTLIEVKEKK